MSVLNKMMFTHSENGHLIVAASLDTALTLGMCENSQQLYLWVVDDTTRLGRVNVRSGHVELIGKVGIPMEEIAFDSRGYLLGASGHDLYRINPQNGALTLLSCQGEQKAGAAGGSGHLTGLGGAGNRSLVGSFKSEQNQSSAHLAFDLARLFIKLYADGDENLVQLAILDGRTMDIGIFGYGTIYGRAKSNISQFQMENPGIYTTDSLTGRTTALAEYPLRKASGLPEPSF